MGGYHMRVHLAKHSLGEALEALGGGGIVLLGSSVVYTGAQNQRQPKTRPAYSLVEAPLVEYPGLSLTLALATVKVSLLPIKWGTGGCSWLPSSSRERLHNIQSSFDQLKWCARPIPATSPKECRCMHWWSPSRLHHAGKLLRELEAEAHGPGGIDATTEQAFGHLPKMNNNLGQNRVRDKNIFSPGW